jgi:hypothetical protein
MTNAMSVRMGDHNTMSARAKSRLAAPQARVAREIPPSASERGRSRETPEAGMNR